MLLSFGSCEDELTERPLPHCTASGMRETSNHDGLLISHDMLYGLIICCVEMIACRELSQLGPLCRCSHLIPTFCYWAFFPTLRGCKQVGTIRLASIALHRPFLYPAQAPTSYERPRQVVGFGSPPVSYSFLT